MQIPVRSQRREDIMKAAAQEFCGNGFERTKMEVIARRAGIGKSTIYEYFPSKKELLRAVSEQMQTEVISRAKNILGGEAPFRKKLLQYMSFTYDLLLHFDSAISTLNREIPASDILRKTAKEIYRVLVAEMRDAIRFAQQKGELSPTLDPSMTALMLVGLPSPPMVFYFENERAPDFSPLVEQILNGLSA